MGKILPILLGFLLIISAPLSQEKKEAQGQKPPAEPEFKIPPAEAKRENPAKADSASIAAGRRLFQTQCVMCHGRNGDGKGDLAEPMQLTMRDYRDADALKDFTDGELFYILTKGKGKMPGEEERMKPEQRWNMINYIRSLAKKEPPEKEEKPP